MALAEVKVLTQPGATGNQTYSTAEDTKALLLFATGQASDGTTTHATLAFGQSTDRGGTAVNVAGTSSSEDNAATSDTYRRNANTYALVLEDGATGVIDLEIALVEFNAGGTPGFTLNWVNLHTTASVKVIAVAFCGAHVTDALAGTFNVTTGAANQNVTVTAGFGQPDLVFFETTDQAANLNAADYSLCLGFGKKGEAGRCVVLTSNDAEAATQNAAQAIYNNKCFVGIEPPTSVESSAALDTTLGSWPTDGFRLTHSPNATFAAAVRYLAIKFDSDVQITTGEGSAPVAGGLPVTQTLTSTNTPRLGLVLNARTATANTVDSTSTDAGTEGIGVFDGTTEAWAGVTEDDVIATSNANRQMSQTKAIQNYDMSATPTLTSEADGVFSGSNAQLSWNDIDATGFLYEWLVLTETAAAATEIPMLVMAPPIPT